MAEWAASLLRRARGELHGASAPLALGTIGQLQSSPSPNQAATVTAQQHLIQQVQALKLHERAADPKEDDAANDAETTQHPRGKARGDAFDELLCELCELYEANRDWCEASSESLYRRLLHGTVLSRLIQRLRLASDEPQDSANALSIGEACDELLQLSVRSSAAARTLAFELFYQLAHSAMIHDITIDHHGAATSKLQDRLFNYLSDMVVKAAAVATGETPISKPSVHDQAWIRNATATLLMFTRSDALTYRHDRVLKLHAGTLSFLLRQVVTRPSFGSDHLAVQEELVELVVYAIYAQRGITRNANAGRKSLPIQVDQSSLNHLSTSDVDRFGGIDLFLAIFYTTASNRSRRLLLVLFFDLAMDQLRANKLTEYDLLLETSHEILQCLQASDAAELLVIYPVIYAGQSSATKVTKLLHSAISKRASEKQVLGIWSTLTAVLQVEEYFVSSSSLEHSMSLLASSATQQQHQSLAEVIAGKCLQMIKSPSPEESFKGERWLAELLTLGLDKTNSETAAHKNLLSATNPAASAADVLEDTFCFDEAAEIRICARGRLWELAKSSVEGLRLAFARVLSVFTRRRLSTKLSRVEIIALVEELNPCLQAVVSHKEDNASVLGCLVDCVLSVVASYQVSYLDLHRQQYDADSCEAPQVLLGSLVYDETFASKILRGAISVDRTLVAAISMEFLVHTVSALDASTELSVGGTDGLIDYPTGDYGPVTALLLSLILEEASSRSNPSVRYDDEVFALVDAYDLRIAIIMARSILPQLKHQQGSERYYDALRKIHTQALESDDDSLVANDVLCARAMVDLLA